MRQGMPKMAQPAAKVSPGGPKWARLELLLPTLAALSATSSVSLRIFTYFYEVFVNNYVFFLKIPGNLTKIKQIPLKFMNIAQKHIKSLSKCAQMRQ